MRMNATNTPAVFPSIRHCDTAKVVSPFFPVYPEQVMLIYVRRSCKGDEVSPCTRNTNV